MDKKLTFCIILTMMFICSKSEYTMHDYVYTPDTADQYTDLISSGKAIVFYMSQDCWYLSLIIF